MNRLHHLQQTLPKNITDNIAYGNIDFVVLDYNSKDGLQEWIETQMASYIESGVLKFYRTEEPHHFKRSHSRNMAFRLGEGDVLCNVDADNFIGPGFASYINDVFSIYTGVYVTPSYRVRDIIGRLALLKSDFLNLKGYNEEMDGYGFEDIEFYNRLNNNQRKPVQFNDKIFTRAIYHSNDERLSNEYIGLNCLHVFVQYLDSKSSELTFLYRDGNYETGTFVDKADLPSVTHTFEPFDNMVSLLHPLKTGNWYRTDNFICFKSKDDQEKKLRFSKDRKLLYNRQSGEKLYEIILDQFKKEIMLLKTEVDNRIKLSTFLKKPIDEINKSGFGKGFVKKNFEIEYYLD